MTMIEPIYDSEDELWFAGIWTGLETGPWSQRNEFYAWPNVSRKFRLPLGGWTFEPIADNMKETI